VPGTKLGWSCFYEVSTAQKTSYSTATQTIFLHSPLISYTSLPKLSAQPRKINWIPEHKTRHPLRTRETIRLIEYCSSRASFHANRTTIQFSNFGLIHTQDIIKMSTPAPNVEAATTTLNNTHINGTEAETEAGLFTSDLVSPKIAASLPESYTLRSLRKSDYARGFLDCLRVLTTVGDITEEQWAERYDWMNTQGKGGYYLLVVDDGKRIVGTGALIVERKL